MQKSDSIKELATALAKAQGEIIGAKKDSANPFFKSKYADLSSVVEAIQQPFAKHGLSYFQTVEVSADEEVRVETMLLHSSGEWITTGMLAVPVVKADAQGFGSALTYARRYSLGLVGVASIDDDGNAAATAAPRAHSATDGSLAQLSAAEQAKAKETANSIVDLWNEGKEFAAYEAYYEAGLSNEVMLAVWEVLRPHSAIRNKLKAMHKAPAKEAA